jgi:hypothetical protein
MARCNSCNGVIAKTDTKCYVCGDEIPGRSSFSLARWFGKKEQKLPRKAVTQLVGGDRSVAADPLRSLQRAR